MCPQDGGTHETAGSQSKSRDAHMTCGAFCAGVVKVLTNCMHLTMAALSTVVKGQTVGAGPVLYHDTNQLQSYTTVSEACLTSSHKQLGELAKQGPLC